MAVSAEIHPRQLISPRFSASAAPVTQTLKPSQLTFIAEVKARLHNGEYRFENSACPCGAGDGPIISEVDRYGLPLTFVLCASCGTIRIDPYLDDASLADFYTHFFQQMYGRVPNVENYFGQQAKYGERVLAAVKSWLKPGSRVYEVGCGAGGALNVFKNNGYAIAGSDYSAELIAAGKERGVENLYCGSLTDIPGQAKGDLIYLNHVFEHMNHPLEFLQTCRSRLAAGGRIVIIVPDVSRIDRFTVPAGDLLQFMHVAHKYNFSFVGIRRLSANAGYSVRRIRPDANIETPHSIMPELWLELTGDAEVHASVSVKAEPSNDGTKMLRYLQKTETLYARGFCRAQLAQRLKGKRESLEYNLSRLRRATPAKVLRKLKGIT